MPACVVPADVGASASALVVSAADPCTGFVLLTPVEYGVLSFNPFNLSPEDGLLVSGAIIGVWAVAVAWRAVMRSLDVGDGDATD